MMARSRCMQQPKQRGYCWCVWSFVSSVPLSKIRKPVCYQTSDLTIRGRQQFVCLMLRKLRAWVDLCSRFQPGVLHAIVITALLVFFLFIGKPQCYGSTRTSQVYYAGHPCSRKYKPTTRRVPTTRHFHCATGRKVPVASHV
jgi:hypothetical protein